MKRIIYLVIITTLLSSCGHDYKFWNLDKFKLMENAISNNEKVAVIYYSGGPFDDQVEGGFYRHAIVVVNSTRDTVNVLTFPHPDLENITKGNNVLIYNDHPVIDEIMADAPEKMKESLDQMGTKKSSWPKYDRVFRDPELDEITHNNYKTVIGTLMKQ